MNIQRVKVYNDGNHYVGVFSDSFNKRCQNNVERLRDAYSKRQKELFRTYYHDGKKEGISKKKMCDYIVSRSQENYIEDWFTEEEAAELLKRKHISEHKRNVRYDRKISFNLWNYFVTFTYDSDKESEDGFVKRLRRCLSNLSSRNGWRYIGVKERGDIGGRVHFHFILYVPNGSMVGELFLDHKYSVKRGKMEYFTNNSFFQDRFGQSDWRVITEEDIRLNKVKNYLLKYVKKTDERLIYSRHVPSETVIEIDVDNDVVALFRQYVVKCIINENALGLCSDADSCNDYLVDTFTLSDIYNISFPIIS